MRIVSLCPSLTELVFALDRGGDLIGITDYCVHPADGVAGVERVGGTKTPAVDRIVELAPDLVLLNDEENRIEDARELQAAGLDCLSSLPRNPVETATMVRSIGHAVERQRLADEIASDIEQRAKRVESARRDSPSVRFTYLIWRKPWMTVNGDTFAHSLLTLAGGINVFASHPERYPRLTASELSDARSEVLLLASEPFPFTSIHAEELSALTGIESHRIHCVDGEYLSWYGSRTPDGIDYAERVVDNARKSIDRQDLASCAET
jgi:ABC-type Fe3+-hydroxamate transport system substrate-binding protein